MLLALVVSPDALAQAVDPLSRPPVPIPGGTAAVARLLGPLDQDPDSFVPSLNALLLSTTASDHDWQSVPLRRDLVRFLDLVDDLRRRFPGPITVGTGKAERQAFERLAGALGFELARDRTRGFHLVPSKEGERDDDRAFRRSAAQALGLRLEDLAARLNAGETETVDIPLGRAAWPLPPELWEKVTGRPLGSDALAVLAKDQRLSLVVDGRHRLSEESRRAFDRMDIGRIYRDAPFPFRRYASALWIRDGRMVTPGGDAALPAWGEMVGAPTDAPEAFLHELLEERRAKGAYFWHCFRFAPPPVVDYYLGRGSTEAGLRFVGKVFRRLDETGGMAFDGALAEELGFAAFARSVPIEGDPPRLHLPGSPALWFAAIKGDQPPASLEEVQAIVRQSGARELDEADFILDVLIEKVDRRGPNADVLPRLIRGVNLFWQHPSLYSPENVVMAARASDVFAPALTALEGIDLRAPETARDYLLTVARLHRLDLDWPQEQLVIAFQGGVEWLRSMSAAGRVDAAALERHLETWSAIHRRHDDGAAAAPEQLAWIARVLRDLPPAPDDAPGRGPVERAMVQALIPDTEPGFSWKGLSYGSDRPRRLAASMVENLEFFGIPAADDLVSLHDELADLARWCRSEDLDSARRVAAMLRDRIDALPAAGAEIADKEILRRIGNVDRAEILAVADEVMRRRKPKGLASLAPRVEQSSRHLAADLRPFLVAPAYVVVLAAGRGSLLRDRELVRKHRLVPENGVVDRAWSEAVVERSEREGLGSWICGHAGTVDAAIASFTLSGAKSRASHGVDPRRAQVWHRHWAATRWHRLSPPVTAALSKTMELGRSIVQLGMREAVAPGAGPHLDLVASVVPLARLEAGARTPEAALLAPSEALAVGLASVERASDDAAIAGVDPAALAGARAAIQTLGGGWRERLELAGPSTPTLNGKASPWLGWWPSYEAVEFEGFTEALIERELVDLHLSVLDYLGRQGLPGFVGADLMRRTMDDLVSTMELGGQRDWQSVLRAIRRIDGPYFDARLRECLRDGLYRLQDS